VGSGEAMSVGVGIGSGVDSWAKTARGAASELKSKAKVAITEIVFCQIFIALTLRSILKKAGLSNGRTLFSTRVI
jgi:hypothetical protein